MSSFQNISASGLNSFNFVIFSLLSFLSIFFLLEYRDIHKKYKNPYGYALVIIFTTLIYAFVFFVDNYMDHKTYIKLHVLSMWVTNVFGCGILYHFLGSLNLPRANVWILLFSTFMQSFLSFVNTFGLVKLDHTQLVFLQLLFIFFAGSVVFKRLHLWYTTAIRTDAIRMFFSIIFSFFLVIIEFFFLSFTPDASLYLFVIINYSIRFIPVCFLYLAYKHATVFNKVKN
jgi:hypothetical protein